MSSENFRKAAQTYIAPAEPPVSRKPPITESGIVFWLRKNLFASVPDTIMTLITLTILTIVAINFFSWAFLNAQWEVAFLNLRSLGVGQLFPYRELWRADLAGFVVVFLSLVSVGIWGRITRTAVIIMLVIVAMMLALPILTAPVPEPAIYNYVDENYTPRQVNFIAERGQTVRFTIDPLTSVDDFRVDGLAGYVENNKGQANTSFDAFNVTIGQVTRDGTRVPEDYDLSVAVQVWDASSRVIAQSDFSGGTQAETVLEWTAPQSGWYTYTLVLDEDNTGTGVAWLKVDNVEVFRSTLGASEERVAAFGQQPTLDCRNCATSVNRTDMRFQGSRTLLQWVSLQFTPYLIGLRNFVFGALVIGLIGYLVGRWASRSGILDEAVAKPVARALVYFLGFTVVVYLGAGIAAGIAPSPAIEVVRSVMLITFLLTGVLYALVLFARSERSYATQGLTVLWLLTIPLLSILLTGFQTSPDAPTIMPPIRSDQIGGLLLTLLLSAVAIVASFPIGILLALGRQSPLPVISLFSTIFIEVVRGVPLITLLFMGTFILPFFGLGLGDVDLVVRIAVVLTLFTSAYLAEVIRGGLQVVSKGQYEAAYAVGLNSFWTTVLIVLPQGLRAVIPAIMGQAVSLFKDTSLVYIIGLYELLGVTYQILGDSQTGYLAFPREGYLYIGAVYFVFSYLMADVSRRIERTGSGRVRRQTL
ncbi:MAG TPA: amino acid ABC transporter permease [Aggregatilineales bacterium]|nr:amino acid ABC transporter permease [Aggregatilineales bacterium]